MQAGGSWSSRKRQCLGCRRRREGVPGEETLSTVSIQQMPPRPAWQRFAWAFVEKGAMDMTAGHPSPAPGDGSAGNPVIQGPGNQPSARKKSDRHGTRGGFPRGCGRDTEQFVESSESSSDGVWTGSDKGLAPIVYAQTVMDGYVLDGIRMVALLAEERKSPCPVRCSAVAVASRLLRSGSRLPGSRA
jgi:hypothetical protein